MTLQYGACERRQQRGARASRKSQSCGLSVNLGGQWKQEKEGNFPDIVSFIAMGFKNEYFIKLNCAPGNVSGSSQVYKSTGFGVGQIKLQLHFCL